MKLKFEKIYKLLSYFAVLKFHYNLPPLKQSKIQIMQNAIFDMQNRISCLSDECEKLNKETTALRAIMNNCVDITNMKKATGDLRALQLADAYFLKIFDKICTKYKISYWLDYGTLLGSVRHKGFIPWDDDIDVGMLREDYLRAFEVFKKELPSEYFEVSEGNGFYRKIIRLFVKNSPLQIDIWPYDRFYKQNLENSEQKELSQNVYKYHKKLWLDYSKQHKNDDFITLPREMILNYTQQYILKNKPQYEKGILFKGIEAWLGENCVYEYDDVFPLKRVQFEGYELFAINNPDGVLKRYYGEYMKLPNTDQMLQVHGNIKVDSQAIEYGVSLLKEFEKTLDTAHI